MLHYHMLGASATSQLRSNWTRRPRCRVVVLPSRHRHPSHRPTVPLDLHQQRKAPMLPQHLLNIPPINRWTIGRRRPWRVKTKRSWLTPATWIKSSRSAEASTPNRNSRSSLFSGTILMSSHIGYQICLRSLGR
jgi:hypothetical protein